jgi:hypothetical protein
MIRDSWLSALEGVATSVIETREALPSQNLLHVEIRSRATDRKPVHTRVEVKQKNGKKADFTIPQLGVDMNRPGFLR